MGFRSVGEDGRLRVAGLDYISAWDGAKWESRELPKELRESRGGIHWGRSEGGRLWAVGGDWNWRVEEGRIVERVRLSEPVGNIWSVTVEDGGPIWVCSYTLGLYRISAGGEVHHFTGEDGVDTSSARFVFRDRQGNRWVGTSGTGLIRLKDRRFVSIGSELGLPNFPVKAVASEPDGSVLLATYGAGLWRYRGGRLARETEPSGASAYVQTLLRDHRGDLWIGGPGTELIRREAGRDESLAPSESGGLNTVSLYEDSKGRVWMAGSDGVASFDGREFKSYRIEGRLRGVVVRCFAEEPGTRADLAVGMPGC